MNCHFFDILLSQNIDIFFNNYISNLNKNFKCEIFNKDDISNNNTLTRCQNIVDIIKNILIEPTDPFNNISHKYNKENGLYEDVIVNNIIIP